MTRTWQSMAGCTMALILTACAGLGPQTVDTSSVRSMEQELEAASQTPVQPTAPPPVDVTGALIPAPSSTPALIAEEERFDITVEDLSAREFFTGLVRGTPYNMVVHPSVQGTISLDLKNVTLAQVMNITRQLYGYDFKYQDGIYKVLPGGLRTEIYQINYLNIRRKGASDIMVSSGQLSSSVSGSSAGGGSSDSGSSDAGTTKTSAVLSRITTETDSDFWVSLQQTLLTIVGSGEGRSVVTNGNAGIVLVKAMPEELHAVEDYLKRSQLILQRQVVLEAKILEVELNKGYEQGINWSYFDEFSSQLDLNGDPTKSLLLGQSSALLGNNIEGIFSAALRINDFTAFIQLLGKQGSVQVLSSPRIATINNQKAVIKVGTDEFFVTGIQTDNNTDNNETSTDVEITPFFSGIALDVTPQIGDDGEITLHVHPTVSEVDDQTKTIVIGDKNLVLPLALSTVRETDSVIKAQNGQIVVIGGLIQNITRDETAEVPLLADIPWLGEAFKQKRQSQRKSELVILIRPVISDPALNRADIEQSRERFGLLRETLERDYRE